MRRLIVEADGGSRGNPGPAASGSVVLDAATGEVLAEVGKFLGIATNNVAEYHGMIEGIRRALMLDPQPQIHVRLDSKLVVEQMTGRWKIKHPDMQLLAAEARQLIGSLPVTFEWIPREKNARADAAANRAMDLRASFGLVETP
ncbi:MAG: reverse transcriptase-like protein [Microbacteriaceae bacterium]